MRQALDTDEDDERPRRGYATSPMGRSRQGNGSLLGSGDARTAAARRFRDLVREFEAALAAPPTPAQTQLIKRAASLCLLSEQAEDRLADGEDVDLDQVTKASGALRRCLVALGIATKSRPRPNDETLEQYLERVGPRPEPTFADPVSEPAPETRRRAIRRRRHRHVDED